MSFKYLIVFKPNEREEDYHIRKINDKNFHFPIKDNEYVYLGEKLISLEIFEKTVSFPSEHGFNDFKFAFAYGDKNIYFMLHEK